MLDIITGRAGYTLDSFDFISLLCLEEVYLAVRADSPVSSAKELIERAKPSPAGSTSASAKSWAPRISPPCA